MVKERETLISFDTLLIKRFNLSVIEFLLYSIIYTYTKDGKGEFFASKEYIRKNFGISSCCAYRTIKKLAEKGLIDVVGTFQRSSKKYRVNLEAIRQAEREEEESLAAEAEEKIKEQKMRENKETQNPGTVNKYADKEQKPNRTDDDNSYNIYKGRKEKTQKSSTYGACASYNRFADDPERRAEYDKEIAEILNQRIERMYEEHRKECSEGENPEFPP